MKENKVIIFDYDGTLLLKGEEIISDKIKILLKNLKDKNFLIILATGRPLNHCQYLLDENLVDYIVSANGSLVTARKRFHSIPISATKIKIFDDFCSEKNIPATFYSEDMLTNGVVDNKIIVGLKEAMNINALDLPLIDVEEVEDIYLMCAFCDESMDEQLRSSFPDMYLLRWHPFIISVLEQEVSKTNGIMESLTHHNISPNDCIAVGDGGNDIDMLQMVGRGIAIKGNKKLMEVADYVIQSVKDELINIIEIQDF
ncbi:hypothetical protein BG261_10380 [Floricoccus tropicus]|uniref:HAD family hydrolase n=1 Tax=Floricoccus tropicus TaxID=1859473 RepID=A0A1E8GP48_9LACT|nr:HAD hydrolase family protein [Floricoccus tropicus]OFI50040.1 hypothetical protein BG261_10380 [Floricoccus tropicus]